MDECGSLFVPDETDILKLESIKQEIERDVDIFTSNTADKVQRIIDLFKPLARQFTVVVANPPYMGSSNMDKWTADFTKRNYPDSKRDLCTCFIERGYSLVKPTGYAAMVTMQSWMFLGSFEQFREHLIANKSIVSMAHIGARGFDSIGGEVVSTTATALINHHAKIKGDYVRLVDDVGEQTKAEKTLEAIANPDCGWFYRADADTFKDIPGTPIAYWASESAHKSFLLDGAFGDIANPKVGMQTSNNEKYLRLWWEGDFAFGEPKKWIKYLKGGSYRKWYGNLEWLLLYKNDPTWILQQHNARVLPESYLNLKKVTWTDLTSGQNSFRYAPEDSFYDISGHCFFPDQESEYQLLAYSNSSVFSYFLSLFNSTMHCQVNDVAHVPYRHHDEPQINQRINALAISCVHLSAADWDGAETSWDFRANPLL